MSIELARGMAEYIAGHIANELCAFGVITRNAQYVISYRGSEPDVRDVQILKLEGDQEDMDWRPRQLAPGDVLDGDRWHFVPDGGSGRIRFELLDRVRNVIFSTNAIIDLVGVRDLSVH